MTNNTKRTFKQLKRRITILTSKLKIGGHPINNLKPKANAQSFSNLFPWDNIRPPCISKIRNPIRLGLAV